MALRAAIVFAFATALAAQPACSSGPPVLPLSTEGECEDDEDCPLGEICSSGDCVAGCRPENDRCPPGTECDDGSCRPSSDSGTSDDTGGVDCPDDMVPIDGFYCMDIYEASRRDASAESGGSDTARAVSQPNVIPWMPVTLADAQAACEAAGKRLCTATEFVRACGGPDRTVYAYGDVYDPVICNSIDTYCLCDSSACEAIEECPYAHCYNQPPEGESEPLAGCTSSFHIMPTGSFPDCTNEYGVYDINGNTWELVNDGSGDEVWRGGAHNCKDSETLHRCDYVGRDIAARGFRCCSSGTG